MKTPKYEDFRSHATTWILKSASSRDKLAAFTIVIAAEITRLSYAGFSERWYNYALVFLLETTAGLIAIFLIKSKPLIWLVLLTQIVPAVRVVQHPEEGAPAVLWFPLIQWPFLLALLAIYMVRGGSLEL